MDEMDGLDGWMIWMDEMVGCTDRTRQDTQDTQDTQDRTGQDTGTRAPKRGQFVVKSAGPRGTEPALVRLETQA